MRVTSAGPTITQPVAFWISALPPAWSGCQWVLKMKSRPQPAASSSRRIAAASGVSMQAVLPVASSRMRKP